MAEVIAGIGTSHVPSIGAAVDNDLTDTPYWKPLFDGYVEARRWMAEADPDITILVYNDHASNFFLDTVPTFALGTAEEFKIADEGFGPRPVPVVRGGGLMRELVSFASVGVFMATLALWAWGIAG